MTKEEIVKELEFLIEINKTDTSRAAVAYVIAYKNALHLVEQLDN